MLYAIQVITGEEERTIKMCRVLIDEQILADVFYPETEIMRRYKGSWHKLRRPMFPGYIFAETEQVEELFFKFIWIPKLTKILGTALAPVALSEEEEAWLKRITNEDHVAEISIGIIEGDELIVNSGPLVGLEGTVKKINRHKRQAVVEVEMFHRKMEMTLGLEVVEKK